MKETPKKNGKTGSSARARTPINPGRFKAYVVTAAFALPAALAAYDGGGPERLIGLFLLTTLLLGVLYRDILRYGPQYHVKPRMLVLLGLLLSGTMVLARVSEFALESFARGLNISDLHASIYGLPVPAGAMLVMLLFDFHTAIVASFALSLMMGLWQGDPAFTVYAFVGCLTAAFCMIRCKRRTAILRGGAFVLAANLVALALVLLYKGQILTHTALAAAGFAAFGAVVTVAVVSILLPILESLFKVTTDISLLELLDLDHPLMKNLMIEAPGTYHHSIIVGNLVEACSDVVDVNPLLARVGAYYHDIGKARMPEYFIENQRGGASKHDRLTPHMSSMVLISHVKEGIEMAQQHKLPEEVVDIIEQHHGNALITYFFEKAKEEGGDGPSEETYRYPGPKPQGRTAALIMMADAVEAASRVLHEPTPSRIQALVERVINHIFLAGQLDECELTLKDITEIKARFAYILTGILHKRIDYPGFDFNKDDKSDKRSGKQQATEGSSQHAQDQDGRPGGPRDAQPLRG